MLFERRKFRWRTVAVLLPMMGWLVIGASPRADAEGRYDRAAARDDVLVPEGGRLDAFDDEGQPVGPMPAEAYRRRCPDQRPLLACQCLPPAITAIFAAGSLP